MPSSDEEAHLKLLRQCETLRTDSHKTCHALSLVMVVTEEKSKIQTRASVEIGWEDKRRKLEAKITEIRRLQKIRSLQQEKHSVIGKN